MTYLLHFWDVPDYDPYNLYEPLVLLSKAITWGDVFNNDPRCEQWVYIYIGPWYERHMNQEIILIVTEL